MNCQALTLSGVQWLCQSPRISSGWDVDLLQKAAKGGHVQAASILESNESLKEVRPADAFRVLDLRPLSPKKARLCGGPFTLR